MYIVEAISNEKGASLDQYPVLSKFKYVFPKDPLVLPLQRELDFTIKIKPSSKGTSKTPYMLTTPNLCEL